MMVDEVTGDQADGIAHSGLRNAPPDCAATRIQLRTLKNGNTECFLLITVKGVWFYLDCQVSSTGRRAAKAWNRRISGGRGCC